MPREVGKILAWQRDEDYSWRLLSLKNCTELISAETIEISSNEQNKFGYNDRTECLDPNNTSIGQFKDNVADKANRVTFYYSKCSEMKLDEPGVHDDVTCYNEEQTKAYFSKYAIRMDFFEKKTKIDFSAKEGYLTEQVEFISRDYIEIERFKQRKTIVRKYELTMSDSTVDPLMMPTDEKDFLQSSGTSVENSSDPITSYYHDFKIDNEIQVLGRKRYNFWNALENVGGFHDGLCLLVSLVMAPIAATCFENDLVRTGGRFAPTPTPAERRNRRLLAETLMKKPKEPIFEAEE